MKKPDLLPRNEWDFSSLRDEEVGVCHHWEFSRTAILEKNPCYLNDPAQWPDESGLLAHDPFPPPWPHQSFQSLDREARKEFWERIKPMSAIHPFPLDSVYDWLDPLPGDSVSQMKPNLIVAAFQIYTHRSHKAIVESFSEWLAEYLRHNQGEVEETRGRSADQSRCRVELATLGILRILRHHAEMKVEQVISLYEDLLPARFSERAAWSRAKSQAIALVKSWQEKSFF